MSWSLILHAFYHKLGVTIIKKDAATDTADLAVPKKNASTQTPLLDSTSSNMDATTPVKLSDQSFDSDETRLNSPSPSGKVEQF